jgi:hypothetical protein
LNSGPYNNLTARKFVMKIPFDAFASAARTAQKSGAKFPLKSGETLDAMLARMQPLFFDATVDPIVTNKTPGQGKDLLQESANNLYVGATMKDSRGLQGALCPEFPGGEARRQAGRGGLSDRRTVRQGDQGHRPGPRGRDPVCHADHERRR